METMEPMCVACSSFPKSTCCRRLGGSSASHVIPVVREFVTAIYPSYLQEFGLASNTVKESRAVVCRTCFGKLEKLTKLRRDELLLKRDISSGIEWVGQHLGLQKNSACFPSTSVAGTPRKRPLVSDVVSSPKKQKVSHGTPERQVFSGIVSPQTPVVSVRFPNEYIHYFVMSNYIMFHVHDRYVFTFDRYV